MSTRSSLLESWAARRLGLAFLALPACLLPGCTKFASELDRPAGEAMSDEELLPSTLDWTCVPEMPRPAIMQNEAVPITYTLVVGNFVTNAPLANAQVRACFRGDVGCSSPVTAMQTTSAEGMVQITLFEGFSGYLEILAEGMLPTLAFFPAAWSTELIPYMEQLPVGLLPVVALQGLATVARVQVDPSAGLVSMYTYDCKGPYAAGVRLGIDTDAAVPYAFIDNLPVAGQDVTSEGGIVGFVNVPPGIVVVTAYPGSGQQALAVDTMLARSGWLTIGRLIPNFAR
jgi:hypothetical protein